MEENKHQNKGRWKLLVVIMVCAAPLIASYLTYYVIKPQGRTNYGTLIDPRAYPIPVLASTSLNGESIGLEAYKGKWLLLQVSGSNCRKPCQKKLYEMRQLRLTQGKDQDRIERVWLITDQSPIETLLMREYDGTRMLRVESSLLKKWLPTEPDTSIENHIYMIDPLGNLMMRFPKDADPNKIKKDISKLLKASSIG